MSGTCLVARANSARCSVLRGRYIPESELGGLGDDRYSAPAARLVAAVAYAEAYLAVEKTELAALDGLDDEARCPRYAAVY